MLSGEHGVEAMDLAWRRAWRGGDGSLDFASKAIGLHLAGRGACLVLAIVRSTLPTCPASISAARRSRAALWTIAAVRVKQRVDRACSPVIGN
jgi:hypothetical protein